MVEMHEQSDVQLLRDYAEDGHEAAFRELVTRHADFVFSAALRQVNSSDLAGDIAQGVFTDLARKARPLAKQMPGSLAGWLHRGTRYAALNHLRDTRRRLTNERQAMEQLLINSESAPDWERIRPVLDEALDSLGDEDREALLLRYFKNQDFRAVGLALGISADTAQKRVSRAVERLREFFSKRNVTIGASGLVVLISANAVQAAPVGLAATISAATLAGTAVHTSTVIAATKTIAMTILKKTLKPAPTAAAVGTGIYEARQASQLREQNQTLQQQQTPLVEQLAQLQRERDDATNQLANLHDEMTKVETHNMELMKLRGEVGVLRRDSTQTKDPSVQTALAWLAKKQKLQKAFEEMPDQRIPEMQALTDEDWLFYVKDIKLDSGDEVRTAMHGLRSSAKMKFGTPMMFALRKFMSANNGNWPDDAAQLKPFFDQPIDDAILQRYRVMDKGASQSAGWANGMVLIEKVAADRWSERQFAIGPWQTGEAPPPVPVQINFPQELRPVMQAYQNANNRQTPDDFSKLNPYVTTPEQKAALENLIKTLKDEQAP